MDSKNWRIRRFPLSWSFWVVIRCLKILQGTCREALVNLWCPSCELVPCQASTKQEDADPSVGLQEFFGFRHERVIVEAVEESYRDCLRCCERHSFDRLQADWEVPWPPWHTTCDVCLVSSGTRWHQMTKSSTKRQCCCQHHVEYSAVMCCVIFEEAKGQFLQNLQRLGENSAVLALCSEAQRHRLELSALSGLESLGRKAT